MKWVKYVFLFVFAGNYAQSIEIDDVGIPKEELVARLLGNSCLKVTNISQSDRKAVAYFHNNSGDFPLDDGIIIRSGIAKFTEGGYTGQKLSSQINTNVDPDLQAVDNASGQNTKISDVAYLEFEFVPLSEKFSFDFIFASNEYGQWQCASGDVFAFLLTQVETGETQNIAVLPESDIPISVRTIKDGRFNENCESDNPEFFDSYQVDAANSVINMRGYTKKLTASATIKAGKKYRIKLVIGDSKDSNYDSAILIAGGSFKTDLNLGADRMLCEGTFTRLNTGLVDSVYKHKWFQDNVEIPNENNHFLDVREPGNYMVKVTKNDSNCDISDQIKIENLSYNGLPDLVVCDNGEPEQIFNLTNNGHEKLGVGAEQYDLVYFKGNGSPVNQINQSALQEFKSEPGETIVVKLRSKETGKFCSAATSFNLKVNKSISLDIPEEIMACKLHDSNKIDISEISDILKVELNNGPYRFDLFRSAANADRGTNPIIDISDFNVSGNASEFPIFGKVQDTLVKNCFTTFSINVVLNDLPPVSQLEDVKECSSYILPEIQFGNYYTKSNGGGRMLQAGDVIENSGTYYIYNTSFTGCSNQSSFKIELVKDYSLNNSYCGRFVVPDPPVGAFYTAPGGPNGGGKKIPSGTIYTSDLSIYYYGIMDDGSLCKDEKFDITILPLPKVDYFKDVVVCNSYILPELINGTFYTKANGGGEKLKPGTKLTSSKKIYIYNDDGKCNNESEFKVNIIPNFKDVLACGSYELPETEVGNYRWANGTIIPLGTIFTTDTEIYFTAETTDGSNCARNIKIQIIVNPIPEVSKLEDVLVCEEEGYTLPEILYGEYFTKSNRKGKKLLPGTTIYKNKKVFINSRNISCSNETSFKIKIRKLAPVENFVDIYSCFGYKLPKLKYGKYYRKPNAQGEEVPFETYIEKSQRIYIYNEWEDLEGCSNEKFFNIYIEGVRVDRPASVSVCDSYVLPELNVGEYFTASGGKGGKVKAGTEITKNTILYIYHKEGERFICEDEYEFDIKISHTPNVVAMSDIEVCGRYQVPNTFSSNLTTPMDYEMFYTTDLEDEKAILSSGNVITEPGTYTMYLKAQSLSNNSCYNYSSFNITIYPLQELEIEEEALCVNTENGEVETGAYFYTALDPNVFEVKWYYNDQLVYTGPEFEAMRPGEYVIRADKIDGEIETGCGFKETSVYVKESAKPVISAIVSEPFKDIAVVNVNVVKGRGRYLYSLDGGEFQTSNEFYNVDSGTHTIAVKGVLGYCGITTTSIEVLKHPKFFTPNSDGHNDTWNIEELKSHPEAEVHIYDRYGAYIAKIKPAEGGWDGSMGSVSMPSSDYWFQVNFKQEGIAKSYRSHFALKRQ